MLRKGLSREPAFSSCLKMFWGQILKFECFLGVLMYFKEQLVKNGN